MKLMSNDLYLKLTNGLAMLDILILQKADYTEIEKILDCLIEDIGIKQGVDKIIVDYANTMDNN